MTTMNLDALKQLGLNDREITLYHTLLALGPSSIRDVAAKAQINRGTSYETLKDLVSKGIVNYLPKGKRRIFQAANPDKLLDIAEERRLAIEQTLLDLKNDIIPALSQLKPKFNASNVSFYEGDYGVETVLKDILNCSAKNEPRAYSVISTRSVRDHLYRSFPNFTKVRIQKEISVRVLAIGEGGEDAEFAQRKWIKGKVDASYIAIYPPKVAMISLVDNNYPVMVVIDSAAIAGTQQVMFDTLWDAL